MNNKPSDIVRTELIWYKYPGFKPDKKDTYLVMFGDNYQTMFWDGEEFIYEDGSGYPLVPMGETTIYWGIVTLPENIIIDWDAMPKRAEPIIQKKLSEEEIKTENKLYLNLCNEKGIIDPPPLRFGDGKYNPDAFALKFT